MLTSKFAPVAGFIGAAVLAAAIGPGATSAFAAIPDDQVTVRVSIADLNMTSQAGAQEALLRIRHAARNICGDSDAKVSLSQRAQLRSCVAGMVERTVAAANLPALTDVSQGRDVTALASAAR